MIIIDSSFELLTDRGIVLASKGSYNFKGVSFKVLPFYGSEVIRTNLCLRPKDFALPTITDVFYHHVYKEPKGLDFWLHRFLQESEFYRFNEIIDESAFKNLIKVRLKTSTPQLIIDVFKHYSVPFKITEDGYVDYFVEPVDDMPFWFDIPTLLLQLINHYSKLYNVKPIALRDNKELGLDSRRSMYLDWRGFIYDPVLRSELMELPYPGSSRVVERFEDAFSSDRLYYIKAEDTVYIRNPIDGKFRGML